MKATGRLTHNRCCLLAGLAFYRKYEGWSKRLPLTQQPPHLLLRCGSSGSAGGDGRGAAAAALKRQQAIARHPCLLVMQDRPQQASGCCDAPEIGMSKRGLYVLNAFL